MTSWLGFLPATQSYLSLVEMSVYSTSDESMKDAHLAPHRGVARRTFIRSDTSFQRSRTGW